MSAPTSRAVILLRQQDRLLTARKRFHDAAVRLAVRLPDTRVLAAYLTPSTATDRSLDTAVRDLVGEGAREVTVVPYLVEWDHPEAYDVPDVLYDLAEDYPEITFRMGSPLGIDSDLDPVVDSRLHSAWLLPRLGPRGDATVRNVAEIAGQTPITTASLKPGDLPKLPAHSRHVFVCFGRRCMEEGSPETFHALTDLLAKRGLTTGKEAIKLSRSKCLFPCQAAPVAVSYPDGSYFCRLDVETVPSFVEDVLVGGGTLPGRTFRPGD